jgi:asparagine synthase (glutamine-hydrolysing)
MCGINGHFGFRARASAEAGVMRMNRSLAHRGPDAEGTWSNEKVVLGHRRLSIIDISPAGNQPFFSADKKQVIVFNGEIYNYLELRNELASGYTFTSTSDTEVMMAAYHKWGIGCVSRFYGMFGFALWDEDLQALFIVRDRLGIKPVYYAETDDGVVFSSEIRSIMSSGVVEKKISPAALTDYLRYQTVHAPDTIIAGVKMLMPGHYMKLDADGSFMHQYWDMATSANRNAGGEDPATIRKNIHDLLMSSVEIRMRSDVPYGAFLSGGIDSSIIVGLMSQVSAHPVKTFSVTFEEKEFDESQYSGLIADKFNTDHTPIRLSANHFMQLVPDALRAMDHPSGDGPNTYVVSKVTREAGVKMALSGLGGDELFAGYDVFKRMKDLEQKQWLNKTPLFLRKISGNVLTRLRPSVASEKLAQSLRQPQMDFAHLYPITRQLLMDNTVSSLVKNNSLQHNPVASIADLAEATGLPLFSRVSIAEINSYMQNVLLRDADQMSMAHALEIRVPFLDHRLVEYVLGVDDINKYPHTPKQLLTDSVKGLIPMNVIARRKMGFTFPWSVWMKGELRELCEQNIRSLEAVEALNYAGVFALWNRFLKGDPLITWSRVWPLVVLGHWVKQHDVH